MDTGCTIREVVGVTIDDIYLDSYLPFVSLGQIDLEKSITLVN